MHVENWRARENNEKLQYNRLCTCNCRWNLSASIVVGYWLENYRRGKSQFANCSL